MLLVLLTYAYHDARFRKRKVRIVGEYQYFNSHYTFYCHTIRKHMGSHNVHIYVMYLQYGL